MKVLDLVLNEDLWFPSAAVIALVAVAVLILRYRSRGISKPTMLACGLNLFYGLLIGIMGVGHLLAISIKTAMGTLPASTSRWFIFPLGFALAVPAWWLVACVKGLRNQRRPVWRRAIALNIWLGAVLLPLAGPLAAPAAVNALQEYDATFIGAARARTSTTKLSEELALELAAHAQSVFKLSGGATVKDRVTRSLEGDVLMLRRVAEQIKRAASEFKGAHHASPAVPHSLQRDSGVTTIALTPIVASLAISAILIACPPLGLALTVLAAAALTGIITAGIVAGAAALVARALENAGSEERQNRVETCMRDADASYDNCVTNHPLIALMGGCMAELLLKSAACLLLQ
ncbi:MAG TPA: hypothetical protein VMM84_12070 [Pyrinomonadaceae bacterium]|nr:hypothetical protein [Pyrinomonadaceae bacterium]